MNDRPVCPTCGTSLPPPPADASSVAERWPHYPFCSDRCRLIDLGRWFSGAYSIPGRPLSSDELHRPEDETRQG